MSKQSMLRTKTESFIFTCTLFIISIIFILSISASTHAADWPMFLRTDQNVAISPESIPDEVEVLWEADIYGESYSSPVVVDGKVYIGSSNDILYCFNTIDGSLLWSFDTNSISQAETGISSTPCVYDGKVYFGSSDFYAYCLDANTGKLIWKQILLIGTLPEVAYGACASPVVYLDKVYFGTDSYEAEGDADQQAPNLFCLDAQGNGDGTTDVIWSYASPNDAYIYSTPAFFEDKLVIGTWGNAGEVICLDTDGNSQGTTEQYWRFTMPSATFASATIEDEMVYIGDGTYTTERPTYNIYAIDLNSRGDLGPLSEEWHYTNSDIFQGSAIPYNDNLYVGDLGGVIHCIDTTQILGKSASSEWTYETGSEIWSSPAIADGRLVIGNFDGEFYCLDTETGDLIWKTELSNSEIYTSAAIADDRIFISTNDGKLFCLGDKSIVDANTSPTLTLISIEPENGDTDDMFTFSVVYTDNDNDQPDYVRINIDGVEFEMSKSSNGPVEDYDSDYMNGEKYYFKTKLTEGTHSYLFQTYDGFVNVYTDKFKINIKNTDRDNDGNNNGGDPNTNSSSAESSESGFLPGFEGILIITSIIFSCVWYRKKRF